MSAAEMWASSAEAMAVAALRSGETAFCFRSRASFFLWKLSDCSLEHYAEPSPAISARGEGGLLRKKNVKNCVF